MEYGTHPASTTARLAPTAPPRALARSSSSGKFCGPPIPRPPLITTRASLYEKEKPDLILFGFTPDSREVAGRLAARLGTGLISNANDVVSNSGGFVAKVPYFGGAKVASMKANGKPAIVLVRPKSFEVSESGGAAEIKQLDISVADSSKRARITERVVEASEKVK